MHRNTKKRICDWKFIRTHKMIDIKKKIIEQYKIPSNTVEGAFMDICKNIFYKNILIFFFHVEISNLVYLI